MVFQLRKLFHLLVRVDVFVFDECCDEWEKRKRKKKKTFTPGKAVCLLLLEAAPLVSRVEARAPTGGLERGLGRASLCLKQVV